VILWYCTLLENEIPFGFISKEDFFIIDRNDLIILEYV